MNIDWFVWLTPLILLPIVALFVFVGCHLCLPLTPKTVRFYQCTVPIYRCKPTFQVPNVGAILCPPDEPDAYHVMPPATVPYDPSDPAKEDPNGLKPGKQAYSDRDWTISEIGAARLRGAAWIQTRYDENFIAGNVHFHFEILGSDSEGRPGAGVHAVYIAYDRTASRKPYWLMDPKRYKPLVEGGGQPVWITIKGDGDMTPGGGHEIKLDLYRSAQDPKVDPIFMIPPNESGGAQWPSSIRYPYMIIIEPDRDWDDSDSVKTSENAHGSRCVCLAAGTEATSADDARQKAKGRVQSDLDHEYEGLDHVFKCVAGDATVEADPPCCCPTADTVKAECGLTLKTYSYRLSSRVRLDPTKFPSGATVEAPDQTVQTFAITGWLDFEYMLDDLGRMPLVQLQGMTLTAVPKSPPECDFSDIRLALLAPVTATASGTGAKALFATPCNYYEIPNGAFVLAGSANGHGGTFAGTGQNCQPLLIKIDHATRSFHLKGGPFNLKTETTEGEIERKAFLDLRAYFEHFAPVARGSESQRYSECCEGANCSSIHLDAGASFQIYGDPLPASPQNYRWYEDYWLVTEKLLGYGRQFAISPHTLGFGVHTITLVLQDDHGTLAADTFDVEVGDTSPPILNIPPNIVRLEHCEPGDLVEVDIGKASAKDACSNKIAITNNAPDGHLFPAGEVTEVTWMAHDGHGNLSGAKQTITLLAKPGKQLKDLRPTLAQLRTVLDKGRAQVEVKPVEESLPPDLAALVEISGTVAAHVAQMEAEPGGEHRQLAQRLESVVTDLRAACETFSSARRDEENARQLLQAASRTLAAAAEVLGQS